MIAARKTTLPICPSDTDFLAFSDGPAWPIRGPHDLAGLTSIAGSFGAPLGRVDAQHGVVNRDETLVVAIGEQNRSNAELYAHLTCRSSRVVRSFQPFKRLDAVEIVLCEWNQLTFDMLEQIERYGRYRNPVGILVGHNQEELRQQVLTRSATAALSVQNDRPVALLHHRDDEYTQWTSTPTAELAAIGVYGHGDGLDMELGPRHVLCGAQQEKVWREGRPDCIHGGYCYRLHRPLAEALQTGTLVQPKQIGARLALIWSCSVIPAVNSFIHPRWSLLAAWLDSTKIGAVLAPWGAAMLRFGSLVDILAQLPEYGSVGDLLSCFYSTEDSTSGRVHLCLFGDPRMAVSPGRHHAPPLPRPKRTKAKTERVRTPASRPARIEVLKQVIAYANGSFRTKASAREAREAALRFLVDREPVWKYLTMISGPLEEMHHLNHRCSICGERVHVFRYTVRIQDAAMRIQAHCNRCGILCDMEEHSKYWGLSLGSGNKFMIPAALQRGPQLSSVLVVRPWWRGHEVVPPESIDENSSFGGGATNLCLLAIDDWEIVFLRRIFLGGPAIPCRTA